MSLRLAGDVEAPRAARTAVARAMGEALSVAAAERLRLVVSELVTYSVDRPVFGPKPWVAVEAGLLRDGC